MLVLEFVFILLYFAIIALVIEISVILFNMTGMKTKVSRFQVISMLTGTGFTTDESSAIIDHPIRRKIAAFLILFGAFSLAVIISSVSTILSDDLRIHELSIICGALLVLLFIGKTKWIQKRFEGKVTKEMEQNYQMYERPIKDILFLDENDLVTDLAIKEGSPLIGKRVGDILSEDDDITILFIQRGEVQVRKGLHGSTINEGDQIYLYGNKNEIEEKFESEIDKKN
ncbi:TrkA C-terminal domain-containing protein [Peribacillus sp. B-H-3]|uniref:TrkA C-terminal domain-containing protein n=1 Tax=Peribacillus sp. B-H-3 TaxID=3400420 RepID=UPI003B015ACD